MWGAAFFAWFVFQQPALAEGQGGYLPDQKSCRLALIDLIERRVSALKFLAKRIADLRGLNPALHITASELSDLYLFLKEEEARVTKDGLDNELIRHLRSNFNNKFAVESADERDVFNFYKNSLRLEYIKIGRELKKQWIEKLLGREIKGTREEIVFNLLLTGYLTPYSFEDADLTVNGARELLAARRWEAFPWKQADEIVSHWLEQRDATARAPYLNEVSKWMKTQEAAKLLNWNDYGRIVSAICASKFPGTCCLSEPACWTCPNNRGLLKR